MALHLMGYSRRNVLRWGRGLLTIVVAGAVLPNFGMDEALAANLGEGDIAILNYAYALEQLEAAFYMKATENPFRGMMAAETKTLGEIRDHEIAHREFFKKALGHSAIIDIEVDFSKINFNDRSSVLGTADAFENLGVAAYNGAGHLLKKVDYLEAAGAIASVEARHTAMIAALLHGLSPIAAGAGHASTKGLDLATPPRDVLTEARPFIKTPLDAASLN